MSLAGESVLISRPASTVVGVGASAGGLEALEKLLSGVRPDGLCAYVIVTHLSPDFKSLLDELLRRHTMMTVNVVEDGMYIEADTVYVLPPNSEMIVVRGRLHLKDRSPKAVQTLPINTFFSSLAHEYGSRAIGIVLSGSGSDGSKGVNDIRAHGGSVIVQDPTTARFDSMPLAAIDGGTRTLVLEPKLIGAAVIARASGVTAFRNEIVSEKIELDQRARTLTKILQTIFKDTGVDFTLYKMTTIYRRIRKRMNSLRLEDLDGYFLKLKNDKDELVALSDDLLITVTEFFRDPEAFDFLAAEVVPDLVARSQANRPIRLWCAACSSGQEVYSLAILIYMEGRKQGKKLEPQIYATDLREASIQRASTGIFRERDLAELPPDAVENCFEKIGTDEYRIIQPIRRWIVFARHDLLRDPPFTRLDFVSCRNVLIYFEPEAQKKSLALFNFGLRDGGILFLGRSESLGELEDDFELVSQRWRVYRKTGAAAAVRLSISHRLALIDSKVGDLSHSLGGSGPMITARPRLGPAYAALIDAFIPDGVLVSDKREVLHIFGDADKFFKAPKGAMDANVLRMAPPGLRAPIAAALDRAKNENHDIMLARVPTVGLDDDAEVSLRVTSLPSMTAGNLKYYFIGFDKPVEVAADMQASAIVLDPASLESDRVNSLERDLEYTRENLQSTIEEVETSNEELQSTNEELMASNEELQSTNEELQSVNEELYTVNAEYQDKNEELHEITRDLNNLMASTAIGVIFVDDDLKIRRYTEAVTRVLSISPVDVGRPLPDITHKLVGTDISGLIKQALSTRQSETLATRALDDVWWQVRVIPLAAEKGREDGAVVTFYDVSELKHAQESSEMRAKHLQIVAELTGARVIRQLPDGRFSEAQEGWSTLSGQRDEASVGFGWIDATHPDNREKMRTFWMDAKASAEGALQTHVRVRPPGEQDYRHVTLISRADFDDSGDHLGWITVLIDVEDSVQSADVVRETEQILDTILRIIPSRISYVDSEWRYRYVNAAYEHAFGLKREDILGKLVEDVLPGSVFAQAIPNLEKGFAGEESNFTVRNFTDVGEEEVLHVQYEPDFDTDGDVQGLAVSVRDITNAAELSDETMREKALITHTLFKSSLGLLTVSGPGSKIKFSSESVTALSGFSALALKQKTLPDLLPEYDEQRLANLIAQARDADGQRLAFETFLISRIGDSVEVEVELLQSGSSADAMLIVLIRDRTASSSAEAALRRRTEELSRSNRLLEIFAAAATHELTSPLRRVTKFSELLREDYIDALGSEGQEFVNTIVDETARMRRTIASVMELARLEGDALNIADVELKDVVDAACSDLADQIKDSNLVVIADNLPSLKGDRTQLRILLRNLLVNAIVYRAPGRNPEVRIDSRIIEDGRLQIAIQDNARGIPEGRAADVFLPFVRFKGDENSIGMGLALSHRVAEAHGGTLALVNSSAEGSTFLLTLPQLGHDIV